MDSDIRITSLDTYFRTDRLRVPLRFGSTVLEDISSLLVKATVENVKGASAEGWVHAPVLEHLQPYELEIEIVVWERLLGTGS